MLTKDTKLRFWCQKVLPLVYDDSLSYYELLNKVVLHLNQHTEDINELIDFYNDFTDDVEEIIRQMIDDGDFNEIIVDTLGSIVAKEYDTTKSYIPFNYAIYEDTLYCCTSNTTGTWDSTKWRETTVGDDLTTIQNYIYSLNAGDVSYVESETYGNNTVGATLKTLAPLINNATTTKRIATIEDLATSENHFVQFSADIVVGGITFPEFSKGVLVTNGGHDASLYAISVLSENLLIADRLDGTWQHGRSITGQISELTGEISELTGEISELTGEISDLSGAINDKMPAKPTNIELKPQSGASNGGYIDFHYGGSAADYTSRLIESANGVLSISGGLQLGSPLPVASGGTGNSSVDTAPTENSTKMVTSGGVFGAINDDPKMKGNFIAQNAYIEISKVNQSDPSVMMQINLMNNTGTEVGLYMGLINTLGQVAVAGAIPIANLSITTGTNKIKIQNTSGSISYYLNIVVFNRTAPIQLYRSDTGLTS